MNKKHAINTKRYLNFTKKTNLVNKKNNSFNYRPINNIGHRSHNLRKKNQHKLIRQKFKDLIDFLLLQVK